MPTINKNLQKLSLDTVQQISLEYLMGWHDLYPKYGFRIKGFNHKREYYGLEPLTKDSSFDYRLDYISKNYDMETILQIIEDYMMTHDMDASRWSGIELFNCRFGREWAKFMKTLVGNQLYHRLSEKCRVVKLTQTQENMYGGVGLAGQLTYEKAKMTNQQRYGCSNVMMNDEVKSKLATTNLNKYGSISPFGDVSVQSKAMKSRAKVIKNAIQNYKITGQIDIELFKKSTAEYIVFLCLVEKFGADDIMYQYGLHPYDNRYPFACDFYIKSLDLFIELNGYYGHGSHWYDDTNTDDVLRASHWLSSGKRRNEKAYKMWTVDDVKKREIAKNNGLNYLVFWDGSGNNVNGHRVPNLSDFYLWFNEYGCDCKRFIVEHPENTY